MTTTELVKSAAKARAELIGKIVIIAQSEWFSPIAGRVLAMLHYDSERVSLGQLAKALQVSRDSISSSVQMLES